MLLAATSALRLSSLSLAAHDESPADPGQPPSKIRKRLREALLEANNLTLYNPIQWKIQQPHAENTHDKLFCKWKNSSGRRRPLDPTAVGFAGVTGADRHEVWLRDGAVRSVHGASRRKGHSILRCAAIARGRKACNDDRRTIRESHASAAKSLDRAGCTAVRLLPVGSDHERRGLAGGKRKTYGQGHR